MTEVLFRNYSHPGQEGGVKGWVSEVDDSSGNTVARVALASGMFHAELAEKASGYPNLFIPIPRMPAVPEADGLMLVSYGGNGPRGIVEIISRFLSGEQELRGELRSARPKTHQHIIAGLVAATLVACEADAPRHGQITVDDSMVASFAGKYVEL